MTNQYSIKELEDNVYVIDEMGKDNIFLIVGDRYCFLIDTGFGLLDLPKIVHGITNKPVIMANSHIHPDHASGNNQFQEIYCGRYDEPRAHINYNDKRKKKMLYSFFSPSVFDTERVQSWNPGSCKKIKTLKDGDCFILGGNEVSVFEIPGHTLGSLAFLDHRHKLLFTGDTILVWEVWGQLKESSSLNTYYDSLKKIVSLESRYDYLVPSHHISGENDYLLNKEIAYIYKDGVNNILEGKLKGSRYKSFMGNGYCVNFDIGGIVYNPKRF